MNGLIILMMQIKRTTSFERKLKKFAKKHFPIQLLKPCIAAITEQDSNILKKIKDHALQGNWQGYREFYPARYGSYGKRYDNWIIIYRIDHNEMMLVLIATSSHELLD
nr:type II toxin-antitoxin system YafQ family toxin [Liquorilactobacillus vini]